MALTIHSEAVDVHSRLAQLGLTPAVLQESVRQGFLFRSRLTANHPRIFYGIGTWAETIATLRDNLRPDGWFKSDECNYELTVNHDNTVAIAVTTGDEGTGLAAWNPSNKCPKGCYTEDAVSANRQLDLFAELLPQASHEQPAATWVLLVHITDKQVRSELSLPMEIISGKIRSWKERIILAPIDLDDDSAVIVPPDVPEIDVPIQRKKKA